MSRLPTPSATGLAPALCAFLGGLVLCAVLAVLMKQQQQRAWEEEVRKLAQDRAEVIRGQILRSMEVLHAVGALYETDAQVSRQKFRTFVNHALSRQPELQALAWDPRVPGTERAAWEERARREGFEHFSFTEERSPGVLAPAQAREEYFPVYYLESLEKNVAALGFNVGSEPHRRAALEEARDTGRPTATVPIRLAQEPGSQRGFVVFHPLYRGLPRTVNERRSLLLGFATAVFRIGDLVELSLRAMGENGVALSIHDQSGDELIYYQEAPRLAGKPAWRSTVDVAGHHWILLFEATTAFPRLRSDALQWVVPGGTFIISLLLAAYLRASALRASELQSSHAAMLKEIGVRKEAEAAAESANRAKSEFLANISHEIRTPMHAILGYAQILARDGALHPFHRDAVATILSSGDHLLHVINEILDLSKIDAGRMEITATDFDISSLLRELAAMMQQPCEEKQLGLRVETATGDQPLMVHGDEVKLRQVLINMLANAVRFTERGRITLRCISLGGDQWRFEVEDTGIGISKEALASVFEPFHQGPGARRQGGTGLGLAIAKRQVEIIGGELGVRSEVGLGSCFHVTLKLPEARHPTPASATAAPRREIVRMAAGQKVRALVVDDIAENRDVLSTMLTLVGCEVVIAEHGRQALEVIRVSRPQIVFLDMRMAELDGIEAARRITAEFASTGLKVVATSASALAHEREMYMRAGCDDFVAKPFRAERIYACLRDLLGILFEYRETTPAAAGEETIDLRQIILPQDLAARLSMAAELHSATVLKSCLVEIETLGAAGERLARHLRGFLASYDMKTIQRIVAQIPAA